jgi:hypothetical protein
MALSPGPYSYGWRDFQLQHTISGIKPLRVFQLTSGKNRHGEVLTWFIQCVTRQAAVKFGCLIAALGDKFQSRDRWPREPRTIGVQALKKAQIAPTGPPHRRG